MDDALIYFILQVDAAERQRIFRQLDWRQVAKVCRPPEIGRKCIYEDADVWFDRIDQECPEYALTGMQIQPGRALTSFLKCKMDREQLQSDPNNIPRWAKAFVDDKDFKGLIRLDLTPQSILTRMYYDGTENLSLLEYVLKAWFQQRNPTLERMYHYLLGRVGVKLSDVPKIPALAESYVRVLNGAFATNDPAVVRATFQLFGNQRVSWNDISEVNRNAILNTYRQHCQQRYKDMIDFANYIYSIPEDLKCVW